MPLSRCISVSFCIVRSTSDFKRFSSKRMPTLRRDCDSRSASRNQGVSSIITDLMSWFLDSGETRASGWMISPCVKDATDFGIAIGDMLSQLIGIESIERLLAAFVWKLHQVRESKNSIPSWLRDHLNGQRLALQCIRLARFKKFLELKLFGRDSANRERHRFGDEDSFRKDRQHAFFAIG